jgi:ribosomal protein L37AE/L43A
MVQNSDISRIEVSKLCCPTCEQLLDILRNGKDIFVVRGCHSTFSPVELPPWLPLAHIQKMIDRLSERLLIEISTFMDMAVGNSAIETRTHTPSYSTESDASFSSGSESTASAPSVKGMTQYGFQIPWVPEGFTRK